MSLCMFIESNDTIYVFVKLKYKKKMKKII